MPKRILLVEDDEQFRLACRRALQRAGHAVTCAADGTEGLATFRRDPPDVLVTDIVMPDLDGAQLIRELRSNHRDAKIVAMSGGGDRLPAEYALQFCRALGVEAVLYKPFEPGELLAAVDGL